MSAPDRPGEDPAGTGGPQRRRFAIVTAGLGIVALGHAVLTWPIPIVLAFFLGGLVVVFLAEFIAIRGGWVIHHIGPRLVGVPLYVLPGWLGTVYVAYRIALLAVGPWSAVPLAAALATGYDVLVDHRGVATGFWSYPEGTPGPRVQGVPLWNYLGWLAISGIVSAFGAVGLTQTGF